MQPPTFSTRWLSRSILARYADEGSRTEYEVLAACSDSEKALILEASKFNSVIEKWKNTAPHKICAYIYDLANTFNRFYHETKILQRKQRASGKLYRTFDCEQRKYLKHVSICLDLKRRSLRKEHGKDDRKIIL